MLMPKRVKRRKQFRGSMAGKALRGNTISNGEYGLVATEPCWIKSNQIEAARVAMTRYIKRGGKVWIKIFPDKPVTARRSASLAVSSGTPAISNNTRPGFTTATQYSRAPLPEPIRVSAGFAVTGLSGKILIQTLPPRLM